MTAVIFDMDGLLLDTERLGKIAWMDAAAEAGCELSDDVFLGLVGRNKEGAAAHLRSHGWPDQQIDRVERSAWKKYLAGIERDGVPRKPGVFELLDHLDARGIPTAVATSTQTDAATWKLERAGLRARFRVIVGGDQVAHGKPDPEIYLRAAELVDCAPAVCLALEDSDPGIRAAAAAGMRVVWVPDLCPVETATRARTHAVAASLSDVIAIVEQIWPR